MNRILVFMCVLSLTFLSTGCGKQRPGDLPRLFPCKITIVDKEGNPVDGAYVAVLASGIKWSGVGLTGVDGSTSLRTQGEYDGVPAGTYKVIVSKYEVAEGPPGSELEERSVFAPELASEETTPLECVIEEKPNVFKFEVR